MLLNRLFRLIDYSKSRSPQQAGIISGLGRQTEREEKQPTNDLPICHRCRGIDGTCGGLVVATEPGNTNRTVTWQLSAWLSSQGASGPLLLMLLMMIAVVVGPIPTLPVSATAGLAFGVVWGTAIAAAGALVGAMAAFWIARSLGREAICKRFPDNPILARDGSQRFLTIAVLLTRLIPVFSFALISYAAGVTAIRAWRFAVATLLGMLPMTVVFAGLGNTIKLNPMLTVLAGAAILAAMAWLPWSISRRPDSKLARWLQINE